MKTLFLSGILLVVGFPSSASQKAQKHPLMASPSVVWAGLDYSMVRMMGADHFKAGDAIFPGMLEQWNALFVRERIHRIERVLGKLVSLDIDGIAERNKTATARQIILTPGPEDTMEQSHITPQDIAAAVRAYNLKKTNGLGLVFIVDRLGVYRMPGIGKYSETIIAPGGAVYVVFFDLATREVISAQRDIHRAHGNGFRNHWFGVIKGADANLGRYR